MDACAQARSLFRRAAGLATCLGLAVSVGCTGGVAGPTCGPPGGAGAGACTRVLFLGNSLTFVNDLPATFAGLAQSAGRAVQVGMVANGGETLAQHAASSDSLAAITSERWTYVVLQEQSDTPAFVGSRSVMYPPARTLATAVEASGAAPMFFMTWAHKDGEPSIGQNYATMQQQIDGAYLAIAHELQVPVAPVGFTWYMVNGDHPEIVLWQPDGIHPAVAGTYLAACVFYAAIFRESPVGLKFHGGVPDDQARLLQDEAGTHVLDMPAEWGLP